MSSNYSASLESCPYDNGAIASAQHHSPHVTQNLQIPVDRTRELHNHWQGLLPQKEAWENSPGDGTCQDEPIGRHTPEQREMQPMERVVMTSDCHRLA